MSFRTLEITNPTEIHIKNAIVMFFYGIDRRVFAGTLVNSITSDRKNRRIPWMVISGFFIAQIVFIDFLL